MSKQLYKNLKFVVTIFSPALVTLISTLGVSFSWEPTNQVIIVIGAITVFLGTLIGIYDPNGEKIEMEGDNDGEY